MRHAWAAVLLAASLSHAATNLLTNPDVEQGQPGWGGNAELVQGDGVAHSGQTCFRGTVEKADDHRRITQTVKLDAGAVYEISFWARSDNQCSVVLWLQQGADRFSPGRVDDVPKNWKRCEWIVTPPKAGDWELQFIVPSTHGNGKPGSAWADDFAVVKLTSGKAVPLSADGELADQVSLVKAADGVIWAAHERYTDDRDVLVVSRLKAAGESLSVEQTWPVDFGAGTYTLWPRLVTGPAGTWLLTAAEVQRQWDIAAVPIADDGPGKPVFVTTDAPADSRVAGAVDDQMLHLAWQSSRDGDQRVWAADINQGRPTRPQVISEPDAYNPAVAVGGGRLYVVYDRFVGPNRDIYLKVKEGDAWLPERRLTQSNKHDLAPQAIWWRGGLWIAWEVGTHQGYRICSLDNKTVQLARVGTNGLEAAKGMPNGQPGRFVEQASLLVDGRDRLWLGWKQARGDRGRGGWDTHLRCYTGQSWSDAQQLTTTSGRARRSALVETPAGIVAACQSDNVQGAWASHEAAAQMWTSVAVVIGETSDAPPAADVATEPYADADDAKFTLAADWAQMGEEAEPFRFDYRGQALRGYFGNFHEHSDISICARAQDSRTEEDYVWMRHIARIDFGAVTDHAYNQAAPIWRYSEKITRAAWDPTRFVSFVGEEWTSNNEKTTKPPGYYGHRNLIFADPYFPRWLNSRDQNYYTPRQVWDTLAGDNFIMIPHQLADAGTNVPIDWNYTHEKFQPVAEIFQARESYEADNAPRRTAAGYPGYFLQDVWSRGIKIGVIASPDHGGGKGKAGVLTSDYTREGILNACRARHTWGTSAAKIALAFTVDDALMGDIVPQPQPAPARIHAQVHAAGPLAAVRVIRNNEIVYSFTDPGPNVTFDWQDNQPLTPSTYYYLRVERQDGELAWSSPVWLERG